MACTTSRPILADTKFAFPSPDFYAKLEGKGRQGTILAAGFQRLLTVIAVPFSPHGSKIIMQNQVVQICSRLWKSEEQLASRLVGLAWWLGFCRLAGAFLCIRFQSSYRSLPLQTLQPLNGVIVFPLQSSHHVCLQAILK